MPNICRRSYGLVVSVVVLALDKRLSPMMFRNMTQLGITYTQATQLFYEKTLINVV